MSRRVLSRRRLLAVVGGAGGALGPGWRRAGAHGSWAAARDESKRGYRRLLSDLGMECLDPVHYINHYLIFLDFIMMHGFGNVSAGAYRWGDNAILS